MKKVKFVRKKPQDISSFVQENRLLKAVELTEMPIGFYEVYPSKKKVFLSDFLLEMFDLKDKGNYVSIEIWEDIFTKLKKSSEDNSEHIYVLDFMLSRPVKWLKIKSIENNGNTYGIVLDLTEELMERKKLEFERDVDPLTGLYNRQAFIAYAEKQIKMDENKIGAMLFADLDNLKFVNDTYGHDTGDRYIKHASVVFSLLLDYGALVSRISGDEFAIFIYGYDTEDEVNKLIKENYDAFSTAHVETQDGYKIRLRVSMGVSWYPRDSNDLEQLLKYADYAMYEIKHNFKGHFKDFNIDAYLKDSYLLEKNEALIELIEQNHVDYAFQPIIDVHSGNVFAYEVLMRPRSHEFESVERVLQLAKAQSKLYQIERMTFFNVFEWVKNNYKRLNGRRIFINSIPKQVLSDKDSARLEEMYGPYYKYIVSEITENEQTGTRYLKDKINSIRKLGGRIAIDDYCNYYANEGIVLNTNPDYIKISRSLVSSIDKDTEKQELVIKIIEYAHNLGIKAISGGIETYEEMEFLIKNGTDFIQGYYLGKPIKDLATISEEQQKAIRSISGKFRDRRKR